ncbi:TetR/AcrR family transcriptional regulator [Sagittula sp. SSi028]|uniref:TetR/AcrR family transcriptional regulator n=1 Tax=Sagittula sp. SSi028 TaxID=3400636 RepID=UPI003AF491CC
MTQQDIQDQTGWRGSREVWLDAARAALIDHGIDAVKVQPLATGLGLSRTSFYWFFKDRAALLQALQDDWEAANTQALVSAAAAYAATIPEAVLNVISVFLDAQGFSPRYDMAVRGWAHRDAQVAARVSAADDRRLAAIREMFLRFGFDAGEADVRARTIYLVQIGYIALQTEETLADRMARIPAYVQTFAGQPPSVADLARFHARHGGAGGGP